MSDFVGNNRSQLSFRFRFQNQRRIQYNVAPGYSKRIDFAISYQVKSEKITVVSNRSADAGSQRLNIRQ